MRIGDVIVEVVTTIIGVFAFAAILLLMYALA